MASRDRSRKQGWVGTLEFVLEHLSTRIVLSAAIILSLIPHDWMHVSDMLFLVLFLPEFVARLVLACRVESGDPTFRRGDRRMGWKAPSGSDVFLLTVDFVALISFLPLEGWLDVDTKWLRLFRLSRTVMLLRYWSPLISDIWAVVRQRERIRQFTLMSVAVGVVAFAGTVFLDHATAQVGEDFDDDGVVGDEHDKVFWVRMWWAFRQIQDPGNMLGSPHEIATLVVSIFLTVFGLFLVSFLIGVGTDVVAELMDLSRIRSSGLRRHTVLINLTQETRQLLYEVMGEYRKLIPEGLTPLSPRWWTELRKRFRQQREFVVVGHTEDPPDFLREPQFARVIYRENTERDDDDAFLDRADVPVARRVVMMADMSEDEPDDDTVRTLITIIERLNEAAIKDDNPTTLIAEVLDESNIGAAQKAIARAGRRVDAHVIPTERLLALFTFCVARRRGVAKLLFELLASYGHELYTLDYRQNEAHGRAIPPMPASSAAALEALYWRGVARPPGKEVVPVGILMANPGLDVRQDAHVVLNPGPMDAADEQGEQFAGFVALAHNLRVATEFADEVLAAPNASPPPIPPGQFGLPHLSLAPTNPLNKVLICGFRPGTVNLVEAIITLEPHAEILILVPDEQTQTETLDAFDGHSNMVRTGLLDGVRGTFVSSDDDPHVLQCIPGTFAHQSQGGAIASGHVYIEVGDWTSTRTLMGLPRDFGTAPDVDAVLMISSERHGSDATTATALMKLEHLQDHIAAQSGGIIEQTVVAEMVNADLAHRLDRRYQAMGRQNVSVVSIHELRAFFMFQSVVVPNFYLIYGQLLAPWGQSFVRLQAAGDRHGVCTFAQLAAQLKLTGRIPVAVEIRDQYDDLQTFIGRGDPDTDDLIDLSRLEGVWIVRVDRTSDETIRHEGESPPPPVGQMPVMNVAAPAPAADAGSAPIPPPQAPPPQAPPLEPEPEPVEDDGSIKFPDDWAEPQMTQAAMAAPEPFSPAPVPRAKPSAPKPAAASPPKPTAPVPPKVAAPPRPSNTETVVSRAPVRPPSAEPSGQPPVPPKGAEFGKSTGTFPPASPGAPPKGGTTSYPAPGERPKTERQTVIPVEKNTDEDEGAAE